MLHLGSNQLTSLTSPLHLIAITLLVLGLVRAVAGPGPERPVRAWILVPASIVAAVGWLGTPTAVLFAPALSHLVAFVYVGFIIAWAWMLRDRTRRDDDDQNRGGDQPRTPKPPDGPSDGGIDWDRFESDFWSHVRDRDLTPV
jgi:hypothetical protein